MARSSAFESSSTGRRPSKPWGCRSKTLIGNPPLADVAGIDWASEEHAVCVVDEAGTTPLRERVVAHDEAGIAALCRKLIELQVERVAIERPDGIVVDRMLDAGLIVIAVHPNQAKAARERYSVAHGKSDRFDAFVLANQLRAQLEEFWPGALVFAHVGRRWPSTTSDTRPGTTMPQTKAHPMDGGALRSTVFRPIGC